MKTENPPSTTWLRQLETSRFLRQGLTVTIGVLLVAVTPVLAQTDPVCTASKIPTMLEGFFEITTAFGVLGVALIWQGDSLVEMFTIGVDEKRTLKRHKRTALKSAVILLVLGPLYTVAGSIMGLPLASCINLAPW
ncbi:hypothetical protein SAMN04487948_10112 [Halogranum amylolyticum]|uniref:Uncharacterized protein n=1 Tax=Halogranum amylolyticum TaxID=660520 RepID=A0A1H8MQ33_9EURY|nr:hypothetical protein SAMN04487948_10112 [Halogranum amylolyticum]